MRNKPKLELLKKVQKVDAPPFLLTRIQAKMKSAEQDRIPAVWQWTGAVTFAILLTFNVLAIRTTENRPQPNLAEQFQMNQNHQLYAE